MPIPAFSSTFGPAGSTRGFWFQVPVNCVITGLSVPNEALQPFQVVEVLSFGAAPPSRWPATVTGSQLFYSNSTPGGSVISTAIPLTAGEYIGVIGACTNAVGSASSYNSYAEPGPFVSDIFSVPTTITRLITQFGIGAGGNTGAYASEPPGEIGRVEVYISPPPGFTPATNRSYGAGCGGNTIGNGTAYERFMTGFDLSNTGHKYVWTGNGYTLSDGASPIVAPTGAPLPVVDEQVETITLPFSFPCVPGRVNDVYLCTNGYLSFEPTSVDDWSESATELLSGTSRLAFLWRDWDFANGGTAHAEPDPLTGDFLITFTNVPMWRNNGSNTVQVALQPNGNIEVRYGACSTQACLVGLSAGHGATDPGATDYSNLSVVGPISFTTGFGPFFPNLSLSSPSRPITGTTINLNTGNISPSAFFGVVAFGLTNPTLDLTGIGMAGCTQYTDFLTSVTFLPQGNSTYGLPFNIPTDPTFIGLDLVTQSFAFDPIANLTVLGIVASQGLQLHIGNL